MNSWIDYSLKIQNIAKVYITNNFKLLFFCLYLSYFLKKTQYHLDITDFDYYFINYKKLSKSLLFSTAQVLCVFSDSYWHLLIQEVCLLT